MLQSRFSQRQRKRALRLLSHPRFRAAFDFLQLREFASPEHAEDIAFWKDAQTQPGEMVAAQLEAQAIEAGEGEVQRRRRRRRRRPANGGGPAE